MKKPYGIHWFRRDLRVAGNPALQKNFKENSGQVVGLFAFDKTFLARDDFSHNRFQFFLKTLRELQKELQALDSDLLVLDEGPIPTFKHLAHLLKKSSMGLPSLITWNRDYEPFALARDKAVSHYLEKEVGLNVETLPDHLLIEPSEICKDTQDQGYQIYTPFSRKWLDVFSTPPIQERLKLQNKGLSYLESKDPSKIFSLTWKNILEKSLPQDKLMEYLQENETHTTIPIPEGGSKVAFQHLKAFKNLIENYAEKRDFPDVNATSGLSIYLKNGSLTVAQIISYLDLQPYDKKVKKNGPQMFFSELIWREFYYHILYRSPEVEHQSFQPKYRDLTWENNPEWFEKWKKGETGFPIVDAGMRQLNQTGWMHNRVRMIVASFLTKDLLIDWRWGEKYFMKELLDGDLAPNNGGWQWAASTGCDAQPYFRIFNPWSQSEKFDSAATYIKKYLPELKNVPSEVIHEINKHTIKGYPSPIVEHDVQRVKALEMYKV